MKNKIQAPDSVCAGGEKGRATQSHAAGNMSSGTKAKIHAQSDRIIGHTFHSYPKEKK